MLENELEKVSKIHRELNAGIYQNTFNDILGILLDDKNLPKILVKIEISIPVQR